ncbi:MAG: hypothetical protein FJ125_12290, partial [Deltaproteobacteria bacterium]|nr:hypothetical protein [Deltaproteobacteria bacterium]
MTALELTEHALRRILAELRPEIEALEVIAARIARAAGPLPEPGSDAGARAYLAVELHRYYTALESALERLLRTLDRFVPAGETWHRELLRLASLPLPEVRP